MVQRSNEKKRFQVGGGEALEIVKYIVGILVLIGSIYTAFACKGGDFLHILAAFCCAPCYLPYGLWCMSTKGSRPRFGM